jgi:hypothetical protein
MKKPPAGNFMQALESIRREAELLAARKDLPSDVKAAVERIIALTRSRFNLGDDIE